MFQPFIYHILEMVGGGQADKSSVRANNAIASNFVKALIAIAREEKEARAHLWVSPSLNFLY